MLALLLHVLLVVLVGNTPGGSARPGEGVWGALNITLRGLRTEAGSGEPRPPAPSTGPTGTARQERFGGAVRPDSERSAVPDTPGAAQLGTWRSTPGERLIDPVERELGGPVLSTPLPAPTAAPPVLSEPPLPQRDEAPVSPERSEVSTSQQRSKVPMPSAPSTADIPPKETAELAPPVNPAPTPAPTVAPAPAPVPEPVLAAPVPRVPVPLGLKPADLRSSTVPAPEGLPMPSIDPVRPAPRPVAVVPVPVPPAPTPAAVATPMLPRSAPPQPEPQAAPLPLPATTPPPTPPLPRLDTLEPPTAPPLPAPAELPAGAPLAAPSRDLAREPVRTAAPAPAPAPATTQTPAATTAPAATPSAAPAELSPSRPGPGAPDAGVRVGQDVATPPSVPPSAPRLNLDLVRPRGAEISSQGPRRLFPLMPQPPELKSKLSESIEKAAKPDCRQAYAGMGLAAVLPLALDAARDKGCKW